MRVSRGIELLNQGARPYRYGHHVPNAFMAFRDGEFFSPDLEVVWVWFGIYKRIDSKNFNTFNTKLRFVEPGDIEKIALLDIIHHCGGNNFYISRYTKHINPKPTPYQFLKVEAYERYDRTTYRIL